MQGAGAPFSEEQAAMKAQIEGMRRTFKVSITPLALLYGSSHMSAAALPH